MLHLASSMGGFILSCSYKRLRHRVGAGCQLMSITKGSLLLVFWYFTSSWKETKGKKIKRKTREQVLLLLRSVVLQLLSIDSSGPRPAIIGPHALKSQESSSLSFSGGLRRNYTTQVPPSGVFRTIFFFKKSNFDWEKQKFRPNIKRDGLCASFNPKSIDEKIFGFSSSQDFVVVVACFRQNGLDDATRRRAVWLIWRVNCALP